METLLKSGLGSVPWGTPYMIRVCLDFKLWIRTKHFIIVLLYDFFTYIYKYVLVIKTNIKKMQDKTPISL